MPHLVKFRFKKNTVTGYFLRWGLIFKCVITFENDVKGIGTLLTDLLSYNWINEVFATPLGLNNKYEYCRFILATFSKHLFQAEHFNKILVHCYPGT